MRKAWPIVRLGEVMTPVQRAEAPIPGTTYRQIGVKLWGEGAYERETMDGSQTKYAQLFRAEEGDIIINKIWARNGSVAVVTDALADCFGSGEFPMFVPKPDRLESRWMHWLTKTRAFWTQCDEKSRGTSGKNRIKPEQFLNVEIPLPPLGEQQRVVARIEELTAQIEEARTLRHKAVEEAEALAASRLNSVFEKLPDSSNRRVEDVTEIIGGGSLPDITLATDTTPEVLFLKVSDMNRPGNEVFVTESANGLPANSPLLRGFRILPVNSIVFPKRGGAIATNKKRILQRPAVLDPNTMGVFSRDEENLTPEFLFKWFGNLDLASMQDGTSVPQINKGNIAPLKIPVPPLAEQRRIAAELDAFQTEVETLKRLQAETATELDALLPAILDRVFKGEL